MGKSLTIGAIISIIGIITFLIWVSDFTGRLVSDPTNPENVEEVALKTVEEATPPQANIILALAPYGLVGAIIIILVIVFWDKIMNTKIPLG